MSKSKKHKEWADTIMVQPLNHQVMVVRPSNFALFSKHMKYHECAASFIEEVGHRVGLAERGEGACFYHDTSGNRILVLPDDYDEICVWHEALHAATWLWHYAGAELEVPRNDEVLTYTQGHIVRLLKKEIYKMEVE